MKGDCEKALRELVDCAFNGDEMRLMLVGFAGSAMTDGSDTSRRLLERCERVNRALDAAREALRDQ